MVSKTKKDKNLVVSRNISSSLPDKRNKSLDYDAVEAIMSYLPVKDVVRLSILSKRFVQSWKFCRNMIFDKNVVKSMSNDFDTFKKTLNIFFNDYANFRADRFRLYYDPTDELIQVRYWIQKAIRLCLDEFELDFSPSRSVFRLKNYVTEEDFASTNTLRILKLVNCEFDVVPTPNSFCNLSDITLQNVASKESLLVAIFSHCLGLRSLKLIKCICLYSMTISAENLKGFRILVVEDCVDVLTLIVKAPTLFSFHFHGKICDFLFEKEMPHLDDVILNIKTPRHFQIFTQAQTMGIHFAFINTLTISSTFIEGLTMKLVDFEYKETSQFFLWNLKEFHLIVSSESFINPFDVANFLKKCLRVERVFLDLAQYSFTENYFWILHGRKYLNEFGETAFPYLKFVKVRGFTLRELPLTMVRFLLSKALCLQKLVLVKERKSEFHLEIEPNMLRIGIPSMAEIEIYEHNKDTSNIVPLHFASRMP